MIHIAPIILMLLIYLWWHAMNSKIRAEILAGMSYTELKNLYNKYYKGQE